MFTLCESSSGSVLVHDSTLVAVKFDQDGSPSLYQGSAQGDRTTVAAFLGVLNLYTSAYLVVARTRTHVAEFLGHKVYRLTDFDLVPTRQFTENALEKEYLSLVKMHLKSAPLFISYTWDLTRSLQHQHENDTRFWWNYETAQPIAKLVAANQTATPFLQKAIFGVFTLKQTSISGTPLHFGLCTRRSRFRAGTRYFRRGIDEKGNVANFNETEQLLIVKDNVYSYVQTRGSVPVYWGEINHAKYRPLLRIGQSPVEAARKHFDEQEHFYGHQYLVNLVNQSGYEKAVKDAYEKVVEDLHDPKIDYVYFDFHHECSKMRWHRVYLLIEELERRGLDKQKWYQVNGQEAVLQQSSVVRTNCMDCLDRTNVVQSCLGGWTLNQQLYDAGVLTKEGHWEADKKFEAIFRTVWADNADTVSFAYSGTGALKTDFTRTGKRTKMGALKDGYNSLTRYWLNNFRDGPRQDSFNLWLGDVHPSQIPSNPFVDRRPLFIQGVPYICAFGGIVFILSIFYPSHNHSFGFNALVSLVSVAIFILSLKFIFARGLQYVNWPKLLPTDYVENVTLNNSTQVLDKQKRSKQD